MEVYGSTTQKNICKLQTMQNELMKLLTKKERDHSTKGLHSNLRILKVEDIHKTSIMKFVQSCVRGSPIPVFEYYYMNQAATHGMETRNQQNLMTFRNSTNMGMKTVHHIGASLWNRLDRNTRNIQNKNEFKNFIFKETLKSYID